MTSLGQPASAGDEFFSEPRRNLVILGIGLSVLLAGAVTILVVSTREQRLLEALPLVLVMAAWAALLAHHLHRRKRCTPALRLERERLRYMGGSLFSPRMISLRFDEIECLERGGHVANVRLRLNHGKRRSRVVPIGMLARADRRRFVEVLKTRVPTCPPHARRKA
ncbi:hypothetical protein [Halotalea alkalilenta]|uniref:hypothetical protein n=1 Tax=Halotalea alkalilenta TaxID=376489 RepID=UPI00047F4874|nr:hypothetical protein [Halotalea alkalilenta]